MISTGGTIAQATELLQKRGVEEIYCFATHAVFSGNATEILQNSKASKVFVTDTIFLPQEKHFQKLEILTISPLAAKAIRDIM
ncbi:MAG: ribose-phosphate pyrophosphokinase [Candidatus Levybacteria bacterium]|nr:ribose-phosphate pyrophosphokinase [Candidatus Levybacteria bacterium]